MPLFKDAKTGAVAKQVYVTGKFGNKKAAHRLISFVAHTTTGAVNKGDISDSESAAFQLAPAGVATLSLADWLTDGKTSGSLQYNIARTNSGKPELTLKYKKKDILAAVKQAEAAEAELRAMHKNEECELTSGCFLTTAACDTVGLADDCWELRTLRTFRDGWLAKQQGGKADIERYYKLAPTVVRRVSQTSKAAQVWLGVYWRYIIPAAVLARLGFNNAARKIYTTMMERVQARI